MSSPQQPEPSDIEEGISIPLSDLQVKRKKRPTYISLVWQISDLYRTLDIRVRIILIILILGAILWIFSLLAYNQNRTGIDMSIAANELVAVRSVLDKQLPIFKHRVDIGRVNDNKVFTESPIPLHFPINAGLDNIYYGYCNNDDFYIFAMKETQQRLGSLIDVLGYAYITNRASPYNCHPFYDWVVAFSQPMQDGWYLVGVNTNVTPDYFH
jgi:hypothetical protein